MNAFFSTITRWILQPESSRRLLWICCFWLAITAGLRPLMLPDEGRYFGIAWEMVQGGNWLVPSLDGMPFFHKPPLFYWLTGFALEVFGSNVWAGRFASLAAAIAAVIALHTFVRKHRGTGVANLTVVILITQPFFFGGAQFANLDMLVAGMITLTIVAVADAALSLEREEKYRTSLALGYVCAALGVLAKGLIGIVLPGAIIVLWLAWRRKFSTLLRLLSLPLLGLFLTIAAPWFWLMQQKFTDFWDYFFIYHHFRRFAEGGFNNQQAIWFYIPVLLLFTLPWSPWIIRVFRRKADAERDNSAVRSLMFLWVLGIVVFFSLPKSKLVGYILPALPAFAYLLAEAIEGWLRTTQQKGAQAWLGVNVFGAGAMCMLLVGVAAFHNPSELDHFSAKSSRKFAIDEQVVMLDEYQYDLRFYLGARRDPWVVSHWQDPEVSKVDNWRKELADAGQFAPEIRRSNLINEQELMSRLCATPAVTYWFWARKDAEQRMPLLALAEQVFVNQKKAMWRLESEHLRQSRFCGEMPSSD